MTAVLTHHSYGKSRIRLTKVTRRGDRHDVREISIDIALQGDFERSYTAGDNALIIPTDTMKNVAFALAKEHPLESIEDFAAAIAGHFLEQYSHVTGAQVRISEQPLERLRIDGREHAHAFAGKSAERRTSTVSRVRDSLQIESGLEELFLLKSTGSAFCGFHTDRHTTLKDAPDRILATILEARWLYGATPRTGTAPTPEFARHCWKRSPTTTASPYSRPSTPWVKRPWPALPKSKKSPSPCPTSIAPSLI